ncbi:sugar ABC transporter permease [Georgenia sp. TF02-10]|uniref:carbohydrate ABC transporter permease n=1 Tax=Georgenia sp. TF02-10 TaxID=2917725 RepID=UPI001FA7A646|nr:sugar ABC transporter permease [Georgenia sp. TF02-10]UNX56269.1 sugar ABC transporter permease [Georgenia sp. TF02-10]
MATATVPAARRPGAPASGRARPGLRKQRRRNTLAALLFISPWIVGALIFTVWPILYSGYLSLTDYDVINAPTFIGLDNYRQLVNDPKVADALWNTTFYTVLVVPLQIIFSLFLAMLLNEAGRASGFFRTTFYLPNMTPPVAVGILLLLLFNGERGLINKALGWLGVNGPNWTTDPNWVKPALVLMALWSVGSTVIILLAALRNVPAEMYDSAKVDGANFWQRTTKITIPMISGTIFFLVIVNTIASFQTFTEAYTAFFGSNYSNDAALFYAIYLFQQAFEFLHMGYASALAWLLFLIIMIITGVQFIFSRRLVYYEGEQR